MWFGLIRDGVSCWCAIILWFVLVWVDCVAKLHRVWMCRGVLCVALVCWTVLCCGVLRGGVVWAWRVVCCGTVLRFSVVCGVWRVLWYVLVVVVVMCDSALCY